MFNDLIFIDTESSIYLKFIRGFKLEERHTCKSLETKVLIDNFKKYFILRLDKGIRNMALMMRNCSIIFSFNLKL